MSPDARAVYEQTLAVDPVDDGDDHGLPILDDPGYLASLEATDTASAAKPLRDRLLNLTQLAELDPPTPIIDGLLDLDSTSVLYGRRDSYKSFIALDMAMSVASGVTWQGHTTRRGVVLYVAAEGVAGLDQRVQAWRDRHLDADPGDRVLVLPEPVDLLTLTAVGELATVATDLEAALVILDTLARCMFGGDENSAEDVGIAVAGMDLIRRRSKAHVAAIHHSGKDPKAGARGSSALEAAADTVLEVTSADTAVTITTTKQKNRAKADPVRLAATVAGVSIVFVPAALEREAITGKGRQALEVLDEIAGDIGASMTAWVEAAGELDISRPTVMRARVKALEKGWIEATPDSPRSHPLYRVTETGGLIVKGEEETDVDQDF